MNHGTDEGDDTLRGFSMLLLPYRIRSVLQTHNETFPNQKEQQIDNPTIRWVFQYFSGIHLLIIAEMKVLVLNLRYHHQTLLRLLGKRYELFLKSYPKLHILSNSLSVDNSEELQLESWLSSPNRWHSILLSQFYALLYCTK